MQGNQKVITGKGGQARYHKQAGRVTGNESMSDKAGIVEKHKQQATRQICGNHSFSGRRE
jgi:hypothetical protein